MRKRRSQRDWLKAVPTALVFLAAVTAAVHGGTTSATTVKPPQCVEVSA